MSVNLFLEVKRCLVMCSMCWTAEEDKGDDEAELAATHILSYG